MYSKVDGSRCNAKKEMLGRFQAAGCSSAEAEEEYKAHLDDFASLLNAIATVVGKYV